MPIALLSLGSTRTSSALLPATNTVIDAGSLLISRDTTSVDADKRCAAMCIVEAALSNASSQMCLGSHGTDALTLSSLHDGGTADPGAPGNVSVCFEANDSCALEDHEAQCSYPAQQSAYGSSGAPGLASSGQTLLLGVLCENATSAMGPKREECDHVHHTIDRINNKNDGWYDGLLPNHTIIYATHSVGCVDGMARKGWLALEESLPGFTAVIGPQCSDDVADVASSSWRETTGNRAVVISPQSTASILADDRGSFPNLARSVTNNKYEADAIVALCIEFEWARVAILHDDSLWGAGSAAAFQESFAGHGQVDGLVDFSLAEFEDGTVHARDLLRRLEDASPSVIVVATQSRVQRAVYSWAFENRILFGPGHGWCPNCPARPLPSPPSPLATASPLPRPPGSASGRQMTCLPMKTAPSMPVRRRAQRA